MYTDKTKPRGNNTKKLISARRCIIPDGNFPETTSPEDPRERRAGEGGNKDVGGINAGSRAARKSNSARGRQTAEVRSGYGYELASARTQCRRKLPAASVWPPKGTTLLLEPTGLAANCVTLRLDGLITGTTRAGTAGRLFAPGDGQPRTLWISGCEDIVSEERLGRPL